MNDPYTIRESGELLVRGNVFEYDSAYDFSEFDTLSTGNGFIPPCEYELDQAHAIKDIVMEKSGPFGAPHEVVNIHQPIPGPQKVKAKWLRFNRDLLGRVISPGTKTGISKNK